MSLKRKMNFKLKTNEFETSTDIKTNISFW